MSATSGETKQTKSSLSNKMAFIGAGIGLGLFALFGILYGSMLGGVVGLKIAGLIMGNPVAPSLIARALIALSMLLGVLVTGLVFIMGNTSVFWLIGITIEKITTPVSRPEEKKVITK